MKLKSALFAGTFEIFHAGHGDVLKQAAALFDHVYVAVSYNPFKNSSPMATRLMGVQQAVAGLKLNNVTVIQNNGFGVICAKLHHCHYLVRGIRNTKDMQYELDLAMRNYELEPEIRTIFFVAQNQLQETSSSQLLAAQS